MSTYESFTLPDPPRLILDIPDATHAIPQPISARPPLVTAVRSSQYRERPVKIVRLVLDLRSMLPFQVATAENQLRVQLGTAAGPPAPAAPVAAPAPAPAPPTAAAPAPVGKVTPGGLAAEPAASDPAPGGARSGGPGGGRPPESHALRGPADPLGHPGRAAAFRAGPNRPGCGAPAAGRPRGPSAARACCRSGPETPGRAHPDGRGGSDGASGPDRPALHGLQGRGHQ